MVIELVMGAVGVALYVGAGYSVSRVLFKHADVIERATASLALAFAIPAIAYLFLSLVLRIQVSALFAWVLALVVIAGVYGFENFLQKKHAAVA
ncbi:MAG TPA: hypothetical protein VGQ00_01370 [Candidatus Norongarragalinales archaeon]|jgi:hypothetical protein|nr:hypothetical protein [Candidatus Norongarragalinales archaeon]